jgi:hypothetical protein
MALTRASVLRGPGKVKINATEILTQGDITFTPNIATAPVNFSHGGVIDSVLSDATLQVDFTPANQITASILSALFPYGTPTIGSSLLSAADVTAAVVGREAASNKITLAAAALSKMPSLKLSSRNPNIFGSNATLVSSVKTGVARSVADSLYTIGTEAWTGVITRADIKAGTYSGSWNSLTFGSTEDGWNVEFDAQWTPVTTDEDGTIDWTLESVTARASCTPIGQALTLINSLPSYNKLIGASLYAATDLVIAATGGLTVTLKQAFLVQGPCRWGAGTLRHGQIGFQTTRALATGEPGAVFSVAIT